MDTVKKIVQMLFWLRLVCSPLLVGAFIGALIYFNIPNALGITLAIVLAALGLVAGILWARRVSKKQGIIEFVSRVNASPDLNKN